MNKIVFTIIITTWAIGALFCQFGAHWLMDNGTDTERHLSPIIGNIFCVLWSIILVALVKQIYGKSRL